MGERLSNVIRRKFVDYFIVKHGHKFVQSSPVSLNEDKSLSFVNAGMNQFKPHFLADLAQYPQKRVCNYQKCIRVGGKMCDLDNIGRDFTHHTFFEMLGNWSFNDYGKQEACEWALDFVVNHLGLDQNKLLVTYFSDKDAEDIETKQIWTNLGIKEGHVVANKEGDNFWEMGQSGPCGMSTEIFYPVGDNLLEIWNLVFIDRQKLPDSGKIVPLKSKFIDTGMGLERVLSVLEGVNSNYDTDLFRSLFRVIEGKTSVEPYGGTLTSELDMNYRILVDHCRMITIALSDGVKPGRKGANFDIRRIIKKSTLLSATTFKQEVPRYLLFDLVDEVVHILHKAYPELPDKVKHIRRTLASETKRYLAHMDNHNTLETDLREMTSTIIKLRNIKRALLLEPDQPIDYLISGRVIKFRPYKAFSFIDICDGSTEKSLQVIIKRDKLKKPEIGSYITCLGNVKTSVGSGQNIEFKATDVKYLGTCNPLEYPLTSSMSKDWFRHWPHLRAHDQEFSALLRVKSDLELSIHMIMKQMDFFKVHTPSLSANDSEASSDLFIAKRSQQCGNERKIREDYFNKDVYLVTSAQLHLETLAASLSRVYTLANAFRAESSITSRHLCEFLMLEAEEANVTALEPLMDRVESLIKFCAQYMSEVSEYKSDFADLLGKEKYHDTFKKVAHSSYIRMSYKEALQVVKADYGSDIGRIQERMLLEHCDNVPIFITNFPKQLKPFYMKCDEANKEALCFDLIAPHGGEICGGSLREDSIDKLTENLQGIGLDEAASKRQFDWYLDLRRFGTFPHGGFGLGFERILQTLLGIANIRDTTAFPRRAGHCPM